MVPELESMLDEIIAEGGRLGELAAAGTPWRDRLVAAVMTGVNNGK